MKAITAYFSNALSEIGKQKNFGPFPTIEEAIKAAESCQEIWEGMDEPGLGIVHVYMAESSMPVYVGFIGYDPPDNSWMYKYMQD